MKYAKDQLRQEEKAQEKNWIKSKLSTYLPEQTLEKDSGSKGKA